jgi:spermidine synthase
VFSVDTVLHHTHTGLQDALVFNNRIFGRVLILDGVVQLTELDNHIYHEIIAHVPLILHGSARRVLIIGGGDGGALKEVLKHPIQEVELVEIDGDVMELSQRLFPGVAEHAFHDPRVRIVLEDGVKFVS